MKRFVAAVALALVTAFALPAVAQDAAPPADMAQVAPDAGAAKPAILDLSKDAQIEDGAQLLTKAIGAGTARDWRALGAAVILLVVFVMRALVGRWVGFFKTDRGGATMALIVGVLGTVASLLTAGGKFQWGMLLDGLMAAFTAAGGYVTLKKLIAPSDAKPAA